MCIDYYLKQLDGADKSGRERRLSLWYKKMKKNSFSFNIYIIRKI